MKIRSYDQQYEAQGSIQSQAGAGDFGGQIGTAEEGLSDSMQQSAGVLTELQDAKDQVWRDNTVSNFQLQQFQNLQNAKTDPDFAKKYGADGGQFATSFSDQLDDNINDTVDQAPSNRSSRLLQQQLNGVKVGLMGHAIQFQAEAGGSYMTDQATQMMQNDAKLVTQAPGMTSSVLDRGKTAIANMPLLSPEKKTDLLRSYEQNISLAAGKGLVLHQPENVLASIAPDVLGTFKPTPRVLANVNIPVTSVQPAANVSPAVQQYSGLINNSAANHNVDPNFLTAQIDQESHGNANAINNDDIAVTGHPSIGIAQFQPATAAQYGVTDPTKPEQAIPGMAAYMSDLLKQFGGDYRKAAAAYNWGPGNLTTAIANYGDKWLDHAPQSTQDYVSNIFAKAAPVSSAETSLTTMQQQQGADPSRAPTNPDWFNNLNWEQQFQIVHEAEQGVRANQVRDSQTLALQKQQHENQQQQLMNTMFNRIGATENPLSVAEVRSSDLDYQGKEHMLTAIQSVNRGENATDPQVFNDLFQRINLPTGDPNKLADDRDLVQYMGHGLSFDSVQQLRKELQGRNTPDGSALADLKKNFFSMAKGQIDSSTFISNDPIGKQKFYEFQQNVISTIEREQRAGGDTMDMFNPQSKRYLGKMIPQYQRTPSQQMSDYSSFMTGVKSPTKTSAPRQPGESPADYLKRTGGVQ